MLRYKKLRMEKSKKKETSLPIRTSQILNTFYGIFFTFLEEILSAFITFIMMTFCYTLSIVFIYIFLSSN